MSQHLENATVQDGERILKIIENSPAKGNLELLYTRRPNAYLSYHKESEKVRVFKIVEEKKIIGTMAKITREQYIHSKVKKVSYICGWKKDVKYEGTVNWGKILIRSLVDDETECYICSVLSDNKYAQSIFEKKRKNPGGDRHPGGNFRI